MMFEVGKNYFIRLNTGGQYTITVISIEDGFIKAKDKYGDTRIFNLEAIVEAEVKP